MSSSAPIQRAEVIPDVFVFVGLGVNAGNPGLAFEAPEAIRIDDCRSAYHSKG
jgi:hypothetical protein